jgi:acetyltransferase EpsM
MKIPAIILGAGGHAMVVWDTLECLARFDVLGFTDPFSPAGSQRQLGSLSRPVLGDDAILPEYVRRHPALQLFSGVGPEPCGARQRVVAALEACGPRHLGTAAHPRAVIAASVELGPGTVVMAGAVINPGTTVGAHGVINTGSTVDHDCRLGANIFIQPGAHVGGRVTIEEGAIIGIGASVRDTIRIGCYAYVGGGAFVHRDVPDHAVVVGVPARLLRYRSAEETAERLITPSVTP